MDLDSPESAIRQTPKASHITEKKRKRSQAINVPPKNYHDIDWDDLDLDNPDSDMASTAEVGGTSLPIPLFRSNIA